MSQKTSTFYFSNNSVKNKPILIIFGALNPEKIWINSLYICPPHLYTVGTLPWQIQNSHFQQYYSYLLQIIYGHRRKQTVTPYPVRWLYYNFATGSFQTKKLCSRLYSIEIEFLLKKQTIPFSATLWGLRDNLRTLSIARWKACGKLPIGHNWTFFVVSYGWDVISGKLSTSAFFETVAHSERKFQTEGASPANQYWYQKTRVIALSCGIKMSAVHCLVLVQSTRVTNGQTNRQKDGRTDIVPTANAAIA